MASEEQARKEPLDNAQRQQLMAFPEKCVHGDAAMDFLREFSSGTCLYKHHPGWSPVGFLPTAVRKPRELPLTESPQWEAFCYSLDRSKSS